MISLVLGLSVLISQTNFTGQCDCIDNRAVEPNRPGVILFDKITRKAIAIDAAVPTDDMLVSTTAEKKRKYQPLEVCLLYTSRCV